MIGNQNGEGNNILGIRMEKWIKSESGGNVGKLEGGGE